MDDNELEEIRFQEEIETLATRLFHRGHCVDIGTARAMAEAQVSKIRDEHRAALAEEKAAERATSIANTREPGRSGKPRLVVIV